ncbi:hypothetical protein E2C01_086137 [Portunus trituberculatus]|uniref:Uncharacterized protein n=1 Tax=Portunus trituberculatus TaxID=210409 RepID=A0A5B7J8G9_PORTR|nr:hypothetical protein [Portunus trituberculatus]
MVCGEGTLASPQGINEAHVLMMCPAGDTLLWLHASLGVGALAGTAHDHYKSWGLTACAKGPVPRTSRK